MIVALLLILLAVLILPFIFLKVEENLEAFLFLMGVLSSFVSGHLTLHLAMEALREPIAIALAVLLAGALFFILHEKFNIIMNRFFQKVSLPLVVFIIIVVLGMLSSVITAIVAAIILVELIVLLPLARYQKIVVCVIACYSIGFGAALTPIGEPLATIAISKLDQDFFYLMKLLGKFIVPSVIAMGIIGAIYTWNISRSQNKEDVKQDLAFTEDLNNHEVLEDSWSSIIIRALKVYLFVMALVFLGEGFAPLIDMYILDLDCRILYWANMVSAVLDNATLTAAEISPQMGILQIKAILMGLLISGGMLIPGNIPNIISASKLKISMTEWAKIGTPMGLVIMAFFFFILF